MNRNFLSYYYITKRRIALLIFMLILQRIHSQQNLNKIGATSQPSTSNFGSKLVLRACCGDTCEEFQTPEEMFGISCCGNQPINTFEEICCDNVPRRRRQSNSYVDRCCGTQTLSYEQTCCLGVVHNIPNGECCGNQAYPRNNVNVLCCNGVLNSNVEQGLTCCGHSPYDGGLRETCCGNQVFLKELFDGCCPVPNLNPPEFREFNSKTHQCCDVPIERYTKTKCCYLRQKSGQFQPVSYDSSKSCCAYPYNAITPKNANGMCISAPVAPTPPTNLYDAPRKNGAVTNNNNKNGITTNPIVGLVSIPIDPNRVITSNSNGRLLTTNSQINGGNIQLQNKINNYNETNKVPKSRQKTNRANTNNSKSSNPNSEKKILKNKSSEDDEMDSENNNSKNEPK